MNTALVSFSVICIVTLTVTFVLFKFLPSQAEASGPLSFLNGINIKVTGSAAFFLIMIVVLTSLYKDLDLANGYSKWVIKGKLRLGNKQTLDDIDLKYFKPQFPKQLQVFNDGTFTLTLLKNNQDRDEDLSPLVIAHDDSKYAPATIHLFGKFNNDQNFGINKTKISSLVYEINLDSTITLQPLK